MFILQVLAEAIDEWKKSPDFVLDDSKWHVSQMFKAQKEAVKQLSTEDTGCARMNNFGLGYTCHIPMKVIFLAFNRYFSEFNDCHKFYTLPHFTFLLNRPSRSTPLGIRPFCQAFGL